MLTKLRTMLLLAIIATLGLQAHFSHAATISGGYSNARTHTGSTPDPLGRISSSASSDRVTGAISASANAAGWAPVGRVIETYFGPSIGVGGGSSIAYGEVTQRFSGLQATGHNVTVRFSSLDVTYWASSSTLPSYNNTKVADAWAIAQADLVAEYFNCTPGTSGCTASATQRIVFPLPNGWTNRDLTLTSSSDIPTTLVVVRAAIVGRAQAWGDQADSRVDASGKVLSITVD